MKIKVVVIVAIILMIISSIIPVYAEDDYTSVKAKVIKDKGVQEVEQENGITKKEQSTEIRILEGEYEHEEYEMNYVISEDINSISSNTELKKDDIILVSIEEKDGEVTLVTYKETVNQNYGLYAILAVLIILAVVIARKNAIKPLIAFIFTILVIAGVFIFTVYQKWNLILIASAVSLVVTVFIAVKVNGINKKTGLMIACSIVGTAIAGIIAYVLFDILKITNVNIKLSETFINLKQLFVTATILFGGVLADIIVLSSLNIFNFLNKPYKRKSDNIIEGQRSLKL